MTARSRLRLVSDRSEDYCEGLDPLLLQPVPLFICTVLVHLRWCRVAVVRDTVKVRAAALSAQVSKLRVVGYVETRRDSSQHVIRLTPLGWERLNRHLTAQGAMVARAYELITTAMEIEPAEVPPDRDGA
ncbi:transcriptional regulator [Amycolatopsis aidingensis]|uniref:transcriptional regulator n=1 Tax=Amycolatopsis aidingensis TaxID=2842453 RepID=UPI001C0C3C15|nr:transcriptional regulator [Amycolatopsis aidingensis]